MKWKLFLLLSLLLFTSISGCREIGDAQYPEEVEIFRGVFYRPQWHLNQGIRGGAIVRADILDYDTFNIVTTRSRSLYTVLQLVFEGILSIHPITGEIQGGIAREYEVTNNGYSLLIFLNENVYFSDGIRCTADDIVFTFEEIYMNPDVDTKKTDLLRIRDQLISIEKKDQYTIQFNLPVPYRPFLYTLTNIEILPKHVIEPIITGEGIEAFNRNWGNMNNGIDTVIGTGPYRLKEYKRGSYIRLVRNEYYQKRDGVLFLEGMPYIDEIYELLDIDYETKILKFQIGEIDFYDIKDTDIASGDFQTLLNNREEGNYRIYSGGMTLRSNHFLAFNQNSAMEDGEKLSIFQNRLFRQAISHLIDRQHILTEVYNGYAYIDSSLERNISPFYRRQEPLEHNPEIAAEFFSQIQLEDKNGDGYRDLPSGRPFQFTILTNEDNPLRVKMAEIIQESLKEAGLDATFTSAPYDIIVTKLLDTFDWEAVIIGIDGAIDPNEASWIWESKGPLHLWAPYGEIPQTLWERRIDELFALGRTEWDFNKAIEYYNEFQDIIARELPIITILVPAELYGYRNGFQNIVARAVTYNDLGLLPYLYKTGEKKKSFFVRER
jgi:peptide/nickel transport system substrate-binding protein